MNLKTLIKSVDNWRAKTPDQILDDLSRKDIEFRDDQDWTWKGIAAVVNIDTGHRFGREGCKRLQDALTHAGEGLWISQISAGMQLTDPEIQATLRQLDAAEIVPGARHVADAVLRNISLLEQHTIDASVEDVAEAKVELLHEDRQASLMQIGAAQWNTYVDAVRNLKPGERDPILGRPD